MINTSLIEGFSTSKMNCMSLAFHTVGIEIECVKAIKSVYVTSVLVQPFHSIVLQSSNE